MTQDGEGQQGVKQGEKFYIYKKYVNIFFFQMLNANEAIIIIIIYYDNRK